MARNFLPVRRKIKRKIKEKTTSRMGLRACCDKKQTEPRLGIVPLAHCKNPCQDIFEMLDLRGPASDRVGG